MPKLVLLLLIFVSGSATVPAQEMILNHEMPVNTQIIADTLANGSQAHSVYKVESGNFYIFDGNMDVDFDLVIEGLDNGWILNDAIPPCFIKTPDTTGLPVSIFYILEGGSITLKNILLSGLYSNDGNLTCFVRNLAGNKIIYNNCVFTDYSDFTTRTTWPAEEIRITNCVFINGDRRSSSPFGGIPIRLDADCDNILLENNTVVNSGRLLGNGGNYFTSRLHELHCTYLNAQVNTHELHWFEGLQANNIFYNWSWRGCIKLSTERYFTTFETFAGVKEKLDSIALYQGRNLFYLDPAFPEFWQNTLNPMLGNFDSVFACSLWNIDVDCTMVADDNFTIGKSYGNWDPMFTNDPSQIDSMLGWDLAYWIPDETHYPDWRVKPPVTWNEDGTPNLNWPPDWDLSYSSSTLQKAGTDGLPLGDLNWFPDAKETYMANRDMFIAALQDSMINAKDVYIPGNVASALITPGFVSVEDITIGTSEFNLSQNYPNPFNPTTTIRYSIPNESFVTIKIYNVIGKEIASLVNERKATGNFSVNFNAGNLPSGIYFYRMRAIPDGRQAGSFISTKKFVLLK